MSLLAAIQTDIGRLTLHRTRRGYETRRTWRDLYAGCERVTRIPMSAAQASEWHRMAAQRGLVRRPFPENREDI